MNGRTQMAVFSGLVTMLTVVALVYVYVAPLESMRLTRDGVSYYAPPVIHPETGKPLDLNELVRHFRGIDP